MRRWPLVMLGILVVALGGRFIYGMLTRPDDRAQIRSALAEAVQASKDGRPGSVVDKLVDNFKVNDEEPGMRQVAKLVKDSRPDIQLSDTDPVVSGDTAQITSDVTVTGNFMGVTMTKRLKDVQLLFKKESATDWLIIPTTKWKLAAARVPQSEIEGFGSS